MPRWFLALSALAGLSFVVPAGQAALDGDVRRVVIGVILTGFCWWPLITWLRYHNATTAPEADGAAPQDLRARGQRHWILPVLLLLVVAVLGLVQHPFTSLAPLWALALAATTIWQMRSGGDQVDFTDDALVVRFRNGQEKRYPWSDVLELSWSSPHWANAGSGPVARVRGSAYDTPGPTSPAQLGAVLLAGHDNRLWGRQQVQRAAAAHGIPFTDDLITAINSGSRKARLPGEVS
ncbi:hypothetical protein [Kineococcus sp. NPDC059986]|uniref:hypothetical protein n=1 Tax=Kineococcus sp. NPDC059986 TaxID=3155538 RepID=UPI00344BDE0B